MPPRFKVPPRSVFSIFPQFRSGLRIALQWTAHTSDNLWTKFMVDPLPPKIRYSPLPYSWSKWHVPPILFLASSLIVGQDSPLSQITDSANNYGAQSEQALSKLGRGWPSPPQFTQCLLFFCSIIISQPERGGLLMTITETIFFRLEAYNLIDPPVIITGPNIYIYTLLIIYLF